MTMVTDYHECTRVSVCAVHTRLTVCSFFTQPDIDTVTRFFNLEGKDHCWPGVFACLPTGVGLALTVYSLSAQPDIDTVTRFFNPEEHDHDHDHDHEDEKDRHDTAHAYTNDLPISHYQNGSHADVHPSQRDRRTLPEDHFAELSRTRLASKAKSQSAMDMGLSSERRDDGMGLLTQTQQHAQ